MLGLLRQVGEFIGIVAVIVEFLRAVGVADVAPVFGSDGVVLVVAGRDDGGLAWSQRGIELGLEAESFEMLVFGNTAEVDKGGVDVEEADGFGASVSWRDAWTGKDHGGAG